jgi:hypothetical protein
LYWIPTARSCAARLRANEELLIEALLAQAAVERFDERILNRFARFDELQLHLALAGPYIHHPTGKLRAVVRWEAVMADE